jgi:hypothetical protein
MTPKKMRRGHNVLGHESGFKTFPGQQRAYAEMTASYTCVRK